VNEITAAISEACTSVVNAYSHKPASSAGQDAVKPEQIAEALDQFIDIMQMIEIDYASKVVVRDAPERLVLKYDADDTDFENQALSRGEISEIGNYGLELMQTLSDWADTLELDEEKHHLHAILVVVALWIARRGGELTALDTVVDTLAIMANACYEPHVLAELSDVMGELIDAVPREARKCEASKTRIKPWLILNINRGIIATRTHDPRIMEPVFEQLVHNIPNDASMFFEQGMEQMEKLDYPANVKEVMHRYYRQYTARVLH
jgi:hypothetical protein